MASPFPGMNPFLEQRALWRDFHTVYVGALRAQLPRQLPAGYFARIEEDLYVHQEGAEPHRRLVADVGLHTERVEHEPASGGTVAAVEAPAQAKLLPTAEPLRVPRIDIRTEQDQRVVCTIELLSPSNKKPGSDRDAYEHKRDTLLRSDVHLVEIDLLRGWGRMPLDGLPDCAYCVMVSRYEARPHVGVWPLRLRDPLPTVPVPLEDDLPQPRLDLQAALHRVYDEAAYDRVIYKGHPEPPLHPDDMAWANDVLTQAGLA